MGVTYDWEEEWVPGTDYPAVNIARDGNEDWPKMTLDFNSTNAEDFRRELAGNGETVEHFRTLPAYKLALASGKYPWLADL